MTSKNEKDLISIDLDNEAQMAIAEDAFEKSKNFGLFCEEYKRQINLAESSIYNKTSSKAETFAIRGFFVILTFLTISYNTIVDHTSLARLENTCEKPHNPIKDDPNPESFKRNEVQIYFSNREKYEECESNFRSKMTDHDVFWLEPILFMLRALVVSLSITLSIGLYRFKVARRANRQFFKKLILSNLFFAILGVYLSFPSRFMPWYIDIIVCLMLLWGTLKFLPTKHKTFKI